MTASAGVDFATVRERALADVSAAVARSDFGYAQRIATLAISRGMHHPIFFNARGLWLQSVGRFQDALAEFNRSLAVTPHDPTLLNAIGLCLIQLDRMPEAIERFGEAIALEPARAQSHYRLGWALAMAGEHDKAQLSYERAVELDSSHTEALAGLASIAARKREAEKARALADRALALMPGQPTATVALAILEIAERQYVQAERRLRSLLAAGTVVADARATVQGLLADALDGQGRYSEAFATYVKENDELRARHAARFATGRGIEAAEHLVAYFEKTEVQRWKAPADGNAMTGGPTEHVFLLGFMRSGTTLLEQVLASSPQIVALEEKGLLNGLGDRFLTSNEALDSLGDIGGAELARCRELYWQRVRNQRIDVAGKILVDKQPLNSVKMPLIAKLFPKAKIIFALRDPRDVVFSCFRRHFRINVTMFEFLSLEDSAQFYALVMRLVELYREKLPPLDVLEHRYEDMVEDFEGRVRTVCAFIGTEWTDAMRAFDKHGPPVDLRSPSATQVRRPLYGEAVAQWRRYEEQLRPILPILKPWVERFGYDPD